MKLFSILFLLGIFSSLFSCKSQEYTQIPDDYEDRKIIFGSGGGFTGQYVYYALLENGQVFQKNSQDETYGSITKISKKEAKAFFKKVEQMMEANIAENTPGNMNYFVKMEGMETPYELNWPNGHDDVNPEIKDLYLSLMDLVKVIDR